MKRTFAFLLLTFIAISGFCQVEKYDNRVIAEKFKRYYNADQTDSIHSLFSKAMQAALPLGKAVEFFGGFKLQAGVVQTMEFKKYEGLYAIYKTVLEKGTYAVNMAVDGDSKIGGFLIKPYQEDNVTKLERTITKLKLPFKDEWTVTWGGDTKELNYHVESDAQKNAFDFLVTDSRGKTFKTTGKTNDDYYAFGKPLYAPSDAEVVLVVDGVKDNIPGILNPTFVTGNTIILKTGNKEFIYLAHLKQHSTKVKQGQLVKAGEMLGLCGNSGNSSEAHLHFHIQNIENLNNATGVKAYFAEIKVNGSIRKDYSPIQKDKISPANF
jgi:murein DD-endopeptidase MepM/ murein hydrolase activator NlpD